MAQEAPSAAVEQWRAAQKERFTKAPAGNSRSGVSPATSEYVPEGQGEVPWHKFSDTRLSDALVARVDLSDGNLMLAATDFDIAGVGQKLQLTRTYNSLDAPYGVMTPRWLQGFEEYADVRSDEVVLYDTTGDAIRFPLATGGTYTTPAGYSKDLKKNTDGTFTLTDRKSGSKDTFDAGGTLTRITDRNHGALTITQHEVGGVYQGFKAVETRSGRSIDLVKSDATHWRATDSAGRTEVYEIGGDGNLVKSTDTDGKATAFAYDSNDRITKVTTPGGRVTTFTYDGDSRVTSMRRVADGFGYGPTWTYDYSGATPSDAGTTTETDPDRDKTVYTYNADNEVTKVTDPLGHIRSSSYMNHLVQTASDAMGTGSGGTGGNVTTYGWDARNNPSSAKLPTGATSALTGYQTVAGADLPGSFTSPDGEKDNYTYDTSGNTLSVASTGTAGATRSSTYNPASPTCGGFEGQRCTSKDANSKTTSFSYDTKGNLKEVTPPTPLGKTTYTYDALGRPETVTDGRGIQSVYVYDKRDRVKTVSSTNSTVRYTYDADGNLTSRTDPTGTTAWEYDPLNRESVRTLQDGTEAVLAYTPRGDLDYASDPNGTTDYTWDDAGRLTTLKDPANKTTNYTYDNNDARTKTTYPGGTTQTVTLDKSSRPTAIKAVSGSTTLVDLGYTYGYGTGAATDGTKIRTRIDHATNKTISYTYDSQSRLSYAKETDTAGTRLASWLYCFDKAGNQLSATSGASTTCPAATYTYNDASELTAKDGSTTGWSYDQAGNETAAASTTPRTGETWTDYDQLKTLTTGGTSYPAQYAGTDSSERTQLGTTAFHTTALGMTGTTTGGADTGFIREPAGTLNSMRAGGNSYYYLTDATGNVLGLVNDAGTRTHTYAYSPTGTLRTTPTESTPQPYRYAGTYVDPTGLYKMGARYYDPTLARFTQPDPSGQETNPYLYAAADPINGVDPTGLFSLGGNFGAALIGGSALVVGTLLGGPVVGGGAGGCLGAFASEMNSGSSVGQSFQSCAIWGGVGAVAAGVLVSLPKV
ncbi:RHS repeat-associated core domain-containing protein [Streptomyces sp. AcH 505]|uniref:RHS repeat-associated core domain-containing protein n=1 Tax=Streptomyces sp. AcH 505 TaxID=352211 RepID=UPI00325A621F